MFANLYAMLQTKVFFAKQKATGFVSKENGEVNIIDIIIVLAIALAVAMIFKEQLAELFDSIWGDIWTRTDSGYTGNY